MNKQLKGERHHFFYLFCGCWNRGKKLHKHSASLTLCFLAVLSVYFQFHYGWLINRYLMSGGWMCSHSLPFTAVIAAVLGCWEEARMFLGHQLPMFSANTALLDLTSCFLSPSLSLRTSSHSLSLSLCFFFLFSLHVSPCWFQMPACG